MRLPAALVLTLALAACGKPQPPAPPVHIEASQIEQQVYWSSALSERHVSLDGYVNFDNGPNGQAIAVGPELRDSANGAGDKLISFDVEYGPGANQLNLPVLSKERPAGFPASVPEITTFDISKATFQDKAGAAHALGERVRVTGRLQYVRLGATGLLSDEDFRSPNGRRLKPRLVDVVLEAAEP